MWILCRKVVGRDRRYFYMMFKLEREIDAFSANPCTYTDV